MNRIEMPEATNERQSRSWAALLSAFVACCAACSPQAGRATPVAVSNSEAQAMPGPSPRGRSADAASALNATCTGCHREIAAEWRASFHAQAEHDPAYQRAFALEPLPFCQGCHAPETSAFEPVPQTAADLGVSCVTCHVTGEHVLAVAKAAGNEVSLAPHALQRSLEFAGPSACASCHEFAFPDSVLRRKPELMQATLREHEGSNARGVACATCHMPNVGEGAARHRSHAFRGGHDAAFVKTAVSVHAERSADGRIRLVLTPGAVGHAFPTGDLFRRVEVSAEAVGSDYQVASSARRYLSRHWSDQRKLSTVVRSVVRDDRALNAPREVILVLDAVAANLPVAWRVAYQRVEHPRSESEQDSVIDGEVEIASGTLDPLPKGESQHVQP